MRRDNQSASRSLSKQREITSFLYHDYPDQKYGLIEAQIQCIPHLPSGPGPVKKNSRRPIQEAPYGREALQGNMIMFRILIVEDNNTYRQSLVTALSTEFPSAKVEEAANGDEALEKVGSFQPDLIFMDIKLPGDNGLELTKKIKEIHSGITVIILTSYDLPEYRQAAEAYGADHFISKGSSTRDEILALVRTTKTEQLG
jgi:CheY-like chemotaxis protein